MLLPLSTWPKHSHRNCQIQYLQIPFFSPNPSFKHCLVSWSFSGCLTFKQILKIFHLFQRNFCLLEKEIFHEIKLLWERSNTNNDFSWHFLSCISWGWITSMLNYKDQCICACNLLQILYPNFLTFSCLLLITLPLRRFCKLANRYPVLIHYSKWQTVNLF